MKQGSHNKETWYVAIQLDEYWIQVASKNKKNGVSSYLKGLIFCNASPV